MSGATGAPGGTDAVLYSLYTLGSVAGLTLLKGHLTLARQALRGGAYAGGDVQLVLLGAALYASSFVLWLAILSRLELSLAYPIAIGLTLVGTTAAAALLLGEALSASRLLGIGVVFVGMWMITRS